MSKKDQEEVTYKFDQNNNPYKVENKPNFFKKARLTLKQIGNAIRHPVLFTKLLIARRDAAKIIREDQETKTTKVISNLLKTAAKHREDTEFIDSVGNDRANEAIIDAKEKASLKKAALTNTAKNSPSGNHNARSSNTQTQNKGMSM